MKFGKSVPKRRYIKFRNFILHTYPHMKMGQSVPKRRHIKFRTRGITQKKSHNVQNTAKVWNQDVSQLKSWNQELL